MGPRRSWGRSRHRLELVDLETRTVRDETVAGPLGTGGERQVMPTAGASGGAGHALLFCKCKWRTREAGRCWTPTGWAAVSCWTWYAATWHLEPPATSGNFPALGVGVGGRERGSRLAWPAPPHFFCVRVREWPAPTLSGESFLAERTRQRAGGFCSGEPRSLPDAGGCALISSE